MFVDASAMCAVLLAEEDADEIATKIFSTAGAITSAMAIYETVLAVARRNGAGIGVARVDVDELLTVANIKIIEIGVSDGQAALDAFERYGKGRHPARLNMGDCFAYACARTHGVPLLFKGDDFTRTDISVA